MDEYGELIAPGVVRFRRLLPGPIERVWSYLVDSELRGTWFASGALEPRVGGALTLRFHHAELTPHAETPPPKYASMADGITSTSRVTRYEPPTALAFTWDAHSEVTFELEARGEHVLLTLTHRRLATRADALDVSAGWHAHLGVLAERLRGEVPEPFWPRVERYEREYPERMP